MAAYLNGGICYNIIIGKTDLYESDVDMDRVLLALNNELDMTLYEKKESDKIILYTLKENILLDNLTSFLETQIHFYDSDEEIKSLFDTLEGLNTINDVVGLAKRGEFYHFKYGSILEHLNVEEEIDIRICYECISFFKEGNILDNFNHHFLIYMERLIRKACRYNKLSGTIKVFVE